MLPKDIGIYIYNIYIYIYYIYIQAPWKSNHHFFIPKGMTIFLNHGIYICDFQGGPFGNNYSTVDFQGG